MLPVRRKDQRVRGLEPSKRAAREHEGRLAEKLGGRVTSGSGNQIEKGDVRVRGVLRVEAKGTRKKSFSVTRDMWRKISDAACTSAEPELPVMHIQFLDPDGNPLEGFYVMRDHDVEHLLQEHVHAKGS